MRAALALAAVGDDGGVPVLGDALDHCDDVLLCRGIITTLGKLRDRRAVPVLIKHLPEVQNRREMVDALGDIGDPAAAEALLERLRRDEYVPVRIAAAKALAKLGDARVAAMVDEAARQEKEADRHRRRPRRRLRPPRQDQLAGSSRRRAVLLETIGTLQLLPSPREAAMWGTVRVMARSIAAPFPSPGGLRPPTSPLSRGEGQTSLDDPSTHSAQPTNARRTR